MSRPISFSNERHPGILGVGIVGVTLLPLALGASPARAAFPGPSGPVAFVSSAQVPGNCGDAIHSGCGPVVHAIYTYNPHTHRVRRLSHCSTDGTPACDDHHPRFSPGGDLIAYVRGKQIWVMGANGADPHAVGAVQGSDPAWAPDGKRLALRSSDPTLGPGIAIVAADGSGARLLPGTGASDSNPAWSAKGKLAFVRRRGKAAQILVVKPGRAGPLHRVCPFRACTSPDFSPDGRKLVFERDDGRQGPHIYVLDLPSRRHRTLARGRAPSWSRDGRRVVFEYVVSLSNAGPYGQDVGMPVFGLAVVSARGARATHWPEATGVTDGISDTSNSDPAW